MKYQPAEIKTVLMRFSDALIAGRSETFKRGKTSNAQRPTSNVQFQSRPGIACSSFDVGRWALDVGRFPRCRLSWNPRRLPSPGNSTADEPRFITSFPGAFFAS